MVRRTDDQTAPLIPSVVVVDPRFDAYRELVAAARSGRLDLHLRASGREALRLAARREVDAWLVAADLEDMSGDDFLALLEAVPGSSAARKAAVTAADEGRTDLSGIVLRQPITLDDLESLLRLPATERPARLPGIPARSRGVVTLPVGIGAAVIAIAVLMMG